MSLLLAGWPRVISFLFLLAGAASISTGLTPGDGDGIAEHLRTASIPIAIGLVMLLGSFSIGRRTRLGFLLGLAIGVLMLLAGLGIIVLEIPYLQGGGEGAAFGGPIVVVVAVWSLIWLLYSWRFWAARSTFAAAWAPADRRMGGAIGAVVLVAAATFLGIGAMQSRAATAAMLTDEQARALVEATTFEVRVVDVTTSPAAAGGTSVVDALTIEIELQSPQEYALAAAPRLCLTSTTMFLDPGYKPGALCWGLPGPEDSLVIPFKTLTVPQGATTSTVQLRGPGSPCPYAPGPWHAELAIAPAIGTGANGIGPAPMQYLIDTSFDTGDKSAAPPPSGTPASELACLVSP